MKKTLLAVALLGMSASAAANSLVYGGVSIGQSDLDGNTDTAYNIHAGTSLFPLPFVGMELGYTDHGTLAGDDIDSLYFALRPSIGFGPLRLYGKAGAHSWQADSDDGFDAMYGFGADYQVFGPVNVGAEFMFYNVGKEDISNFALTASFNFL
ncbi:outer membrane beta-barrel protein [Vibrio sp. WXL103]|uniref:outer membrane beta-barrel protein n=1 Tax=unclassified Vibrio TaxID=2614977 RepID=UPI003EC57F89